MTNDPIKFHAGRLDAFIPSAPSGSSSTHAAGAFPDLPADFHDEFFAAVRDAAMELARRQRDETLTRIAALDDAILKADTAGDRHTVLKLSDERRSLEELLAE